MSLDKLKLLLLGTTFDVWLVLDIEESSRLLLVRSVRSSVCVVVLGDKKQHSAVQRSTGTTVLCTTWVLPEGGSIFEFCNKSAKSG